MKLIPLVLCFFFSAGLFATTTGRTAKDVGEGTRVVEELLANYDDIRLALAERKLDPARERAKQLTHECAIWLTEHPAQQRIAPFINRLKKRAWEVAGATSLEKATGSFGELSKAALRLVKRTEPLHSAWYKYECEDAKTSYYWLQSERDTRTLNPYLAGAPDCGTLVPWNQVKL